MSILNNNIRAGASSQNQAYNIQRSLRFRSSASAYLSRTPSGSGNRQTMTFSAWVKYSVVNNYSALFSALNAAGTDQDVVYINNGSNQLVIRIDAVGAFLQTTQVFRDPSAWYHIVVAIDTTQAVATDRLKVYVNGSLVTSFVTDNRSSITQNLNMTCWNTASRLQFIGTQAQSYPAYTWNGYIAEHYFIDGQALTPSSFGESDTVTGVWKPKRYTGTYGTNGFKLDFSDNSAATAAAIGKDSSGNGNNWTPNNISVTAGVTYDSMTDVPTLTSATAANYAVLNPLDVEASVTLTDGNLSLSGGNNIRATMGNFGSGKYYYEGTKTNATSSPNFGHFGIASSAKSIGTMLTASVLYRSDGNFYVNDTQTTTYASYTTNDVIGVAIDCDSSQVSFYKNNTLQGTVSFPSGITAANVVPAARNNSGQTSAWNFGQRPFTYTPPTGHKAINTFNLPTPAIPAGNKVMDATTYTGAGGTQTVTNAGGFKPDLVWLKGRNNTGSHVLQDSVRGVGSATKLSTNSTNAENNSAADATDPIYGYITALNSNGFTGYAGTTPAQVNTSGQTYVAWQFQAGQGSSSSNTSGSITSTVSVNPSAGFSIATFTSQSTGTGTFGHGLGVPPSLVILKNRTDPTGYWIVYHASMGNGGYLALQNTNSFSTSANIFNNTSPTSSVFTLGSSYSGSQPTVAYCWSEVAGFSKFGSYTGNGSADGTFVYTGFRPKFVILKNATNAAYGWTIWDTTRNTFNVVDKYLQSNGYVAEDVFTSLDALSNGFKMRTSSDSLNQSGGTHIYMAFAENPFKYSLAR